VILRAGDLIEWAWGDNNHKTLFIILDDDQWPRARNTFQVYVMSDTFDPNLSLGLSLSFKTKYLDNITYTAFDNALRKNKIKKLIDINSLTQTMKENHD
jgi:hypothetical protein